MGCGASKNTEISANQTSVEKAASANDDNTLNESRIKLVKESWEKAKGLGAETVGVLLFKNIFTIAPGAL